MPPPKHRPDHDTPLWSDEHRMTTAPSDRFIGRISIDATSGAAFSDVRIRLLEAIAQTGSINQAAKAVPLSYKAAWDAVETMNNLAPEPLVQRTAGGRRGGGTRLTDYGRQIIALYRALEIETREALERVSARLGNGAPLDVAGYRALMQPIAMKTSARNQFSGPIVALRDAGVDFEVSLRLDADTEIFATVTRASAENLGLAIGKQVTALVKSPSVTLSATSAEPPDARINCLRGVITSIHEGAVNDELGLRLPSGRSIIAVMPHGASATCGLVEGTPAWAHFKPSSVILAIND